MKILIEKCYDENKVKTFIETYYNLIDVISITHVYTKTNWEFIIFYKLK